MFILSKNACFLTRASPNTFSRGFTRGDRGLQGVTRGLQRVTGGYKGLQAVTNDYRNFF